jgi:hypothetical protein
VRGGGWSIPSCRRIDAVNRRADIPDSAPSVRRSHLRWHCCQRSPHPTRQRQTIRRPNPNSPCSSLITCPLIPSWFDPLQIPPSPTGCLLPRDMSVLELPPPSFRLARAPSDRGAASGAGTSGVRWPLSGIITGEWWRPRLPWPLRLSCRSHGAPEAPSPPLGSTPP